MTEEFIEPSDIQLLVALDFRPNGRAICYTDYWDIPVAYHSVSTLLVYNRYPSYLTSTSPCAARANNYPSFLMGQNVCVIHPELADILSEGFRPNLSA
jgi:hypothetical protein